MMRDLPIQDEIGYPLVTKRMVFAQISLCQGCCCGNVGRGKPEVPIDRLKMEWKTRGLGKSIQLTLSGCLGPCDVINVVRISTQAGDWWFGGFQTTDDYLELVTWAEISKAAGHLAPFSEQMMARRFNPFWKMDVAAHGLPRHATTFSEQEGV